MVIASPKRNTDGAPLPMRSRTRGSIYGILFVSPYFESAPVRLVTPRRALGLSPAPLCRLAPVTH